MLPPTRSDIPPKEADLIPSPLGSPTGVLREGPSGHADCSSQSGRGPSQPHGHPPPPRSLALSLSKRPSTRAPSIHYLLWKPNLPSGRKEINPIPSPLGRGPSRHDDCSSQSGSPLHGHPPPPRSLGLSWWLSPSKPLTFTLRPSVRLFTWY